MESVQCHYNTPFKCLKSAIKTLAKSMKYVQGKIIQIKMSGGNSMGGGEFSEEWGVLSRGDLSRGGGGGLIVWG